MCGRFNYGSDIRQVQGWADTLVNWPEQSDSFNVAPTTQITAFRGDSGELMRWGMIAHWSKEFDSKFATFNARIETVEGKPTFRNAWKKSQRCLIPMTGYYEWKGQKGDKQPFYITDRDAGIIVTAGLYEAWGDSQHSCTMLTMPANKELVHIHARMPIMLSNESANNWLCGKLDKNGLLATESPNVIYYPVSKEVSNVRNSSANLIEPIDL